MVQLYAYFRKPKLLTILLLQCIFVLCAVVNSHAQSTPPTITSFSPLEGRVGDEITITGTGFIGATLVYVGGGSATDFTVVSNTEIKVRIPVSASTGRVQVRSNNGNAYSSKDFKVIEAPSINSFYPNKGPVGTVISINGSNLSNASLVYIGRGVASNIMVISESEIRVTVPALASTGKISVQTDKGQVLSYTEFTVEGAPLVNAFSPNSGKVGDVVTITGQNFTGATHVYIGSGTIASNNFISINDNEIKVRVPALASTGSIKVRTTSGQATAPGAFTVESAPVINSFSPTYGPIGTLVTIIGKNLIGASRIYVGSGYTTDFTIVSDTEIRVYIPSTSTSGNLRVLTSGGADYSSGAYTVLAPFITLTPSSLSFTDVPSGSEEMKQYQVSGEGLTNGTPVSINIGDATSPFTISTSQNGTYSRSLSLSSVTNNKLNATTIWVKYSPLSPTAEGAPQTSSIVHTQGSTSGTLPLNATAVGPMPVELAYFTAKSKDGAVVLEWKTASEENNSRFEVEMAVGTLNDFRKVATVASKASNSTSLTSYKHQQQLLNYGQTLYFRLKQVDLDGAFSYSKTVSVESFAQQEKMQPIVAPNPVNSDSRLILTSNESVKATIYLSSLAGKRILTKAIIVLKGHNEIDLPMLSTLEKGMYILNIELDGRMHQVKVIKN